MFKIMRLLITAALLLTALSGWISASAETVSASPLTPGRNATASVSAGGQTAFFSYTPAQTGVYVFRSSGNAGTCGFLYDAGLSVIASDNQYSGGGNFSIAMELTGGTKYYFGAKYCDDSKTGSFPVTLVKPDFHWTLENGVLTVSGTTFPDFSDNTSPWYSQRSSIASVVIEDGMTRIGRYAFSRCYDLETAAIPASLTEIGENAFLFCESLSAVTGPSGVSAADYYYFDGTLRVASVPSCVRKTGPRAFEGTAMGRRISSDFFLPSSWENSLVIEEEAFAGIGAVYVTVPYSVSRISSRTFADCPNLRYVLIGNENCEIADNAFEGCSDSLILISYVGRPSNLPTKVSLFAESHGYQFVGGYGENW